MDNNVVESDSVQMHKIAKYLESRGFPSCTVSGRREEHDSGSPSLSILIGNKK